VNSQQSIERVIESIHQNIGEPITVDDMARTAMFSKFHFTRLFQHATGVSPGRFLSAVRFQEAKRLLLSTSLSVTEISHQVGYSSVGTFSSRFKSSVGLSPTAYRQLCGYTPQINPDTQRRSPHPAVVQGEIVAPPEGLGKGTVFIGLFPDAIPQGTPVRCVVLERPGPFRLEDVPEGDWYLLGQSVRPGEEVVVGAAPPTIVVHGPITIRRNVLIGPLRLELRPMRSLDPPILIALLDARRVALDARPAPAPADRAEAV
jgi:AraC family transcriptional regulator